MRSTPNLLAIVVGWCSIHGVAAASDVPDPSVASRPDTITVDRGGSGESTGLVGQGVVQLEMGVLVDRTRGDEGTYWLVAVPVSALRVGFTSRLEAQFAMEGWLVESTVLEDVRSRSSGHSDVVASLKHALILEESGPANVSVRGALSLPTGGRAVSGDGFDPAAAVAIDRSVAPDASIFASGALASVSGASGREAVMVLTTGASRGIGPGMEAFVELHTYTARRTGVGTSLGLNVGLARLVGPNLQLDAYVGRGLRGAIPQWTASLGIAVRRTPATR